MIYIWDNGEDFSDHAVWFVESDLEPEAVEHLLNAAVNPFARRGGVIAVMEKDSNVSWKQDRIEPLEAWFTYYGDALVNWRVRGVHDALLKLPHETLVRLAKRLTPGNAVILSERLGLDL